MIRVSSPVSTPFQAIADRLPRSCLGELRGERRFLMWRERLLLLVAALVTSALASSPEAALQVGFYQPTCPIAEDVVLEEMKLILLEDSTLMPSLLRMHYHDCFVQGCDGSIMLKSRKGKAERDALPNRSMRGYDAIERIKARLETVCPLTVSCADIIAIAARDAVYLSEGPWYDVETGRRDGNVTVAEYAENDLAPPDSNIVDVKTFFSVKSLNSKDIAVLFGCHSIGTSHCEPIQQRLYNFTGKMDRDPSLDPAYAAQLKKLCPPPGPGDRGQGKTKVPMDPGSGNTFDLSYYRHVLATGGLFQSDSSLLDDPVTRGYVKKVANATSPDEYYVDFAAAMVKMGRTDVLYGDLGEIRPTCGAFVD
ncbi:peroxidase 1-like [Phragmites australis]|uniref:peroxidase 1-like n=1 Tax=Phragmites australis TaxID=29695 RepID=UPI002D7814B4|nr:peroxidase 1-like [Phragmites australis]